MRIVFSGVLLLLASCYIDRGDSATGLFLSLLSYDLSEKFDDFGRCVANTATAGDVETFQKISDTGGSFDGVLNNGDNFGHAMAALDLDGDCRMELAVGAHYDDDGGGWDKGAIWILFLNADGTVRSHQKISDTEGGFTAGLNNGDQFGHALGTADINNDGIPELLVGAKDDGDMLYYCSYYCDYGALYVLFLNPDGTVNSHRKITSMQNGFDVTLDMGDEFGLGPTGIGDLDGDGVTELVTGSLIDYDGPDRGGLWILFMNTDGTVKSQRVIFSSIFGGFDGILMDYDRFGSFNAGLGDFDGDGVPDLATAAYNDSDDGNTNAGAIWTLFLNPDGTVKTDRKISSFIGNSGMQIDAGDQFGHGLIAPGDLNGDGIMDLVTGAPFDEDAGAGAGAAWPVFLGRDGIPAGHGKISDGVTGNFHARLEDNDNFGSSIAYPGDLNGDGIHDLFVSARGDDDGGTDRGAVYVLFLQAAQ